MLRLKGIDDGLRARLSVIVGEKMADDVVAELSKGIPLLFETDEHLAVELPMMRLGDSVSGKLVIRPYTRQGMPADLDGEAPMKMSAVSRYRMVAEIDGRPIHGVGFLDFGGKPLVDSSSREALVVRISFIPMIPTQNGVDK